MTTDAIGALRRTERGYDARMTDRSKAWWRCGVIDTQEPARSMVCEDLLPVLHASRHARDVVTEACLRWGLPQLIGPAALIISELVSNAADHARTLMTVEVACRESHLYLAVRDGSRTPPIIRDVTDEALPTRGRGLMLVASAATAWGCHQEDSGKTVWATVAFDPEVPTMLR